MTDISKYMQPESQTVQAIYEHYKKVGDSEPQRGYLGASIIGHECDMYLWCCFRQCCKPDIDGRTYRLFETGQLAEERFLNDLANIGCEVHGSDEDGKQFAVSALGGHFSGHMDGCALGLPEAPQTWHLLEFKTHHAKSFKALKATGVQSSKPMHYAQMQVYMLLGGLTRALYLAVNKDTDELYAERIKLDKPFAESLIEKARRIIEAPSPPTGISDRADYWKCKYCDAREICHSGADSVALPVLNLSCRQCCYATPRIDGVGACWECTHPKHDPIADTDHPCDDFMCIPDLIAFAEVDYVQDGHIRFTCVQSGVSFSHGKNYVTGNMLLTITESQLSAHFIHGN